MHLFKRFTALLLAVVLVTGLLPAQVRAEEQELLTFETTVVNPLYEGILTEDDLLSSVHSEVQTYRDSDEVQSIDEAGEIIRESMKDRQESVNVFVFDTEATQESFDALVENIMYAALDHTGVPTEGDYLAWQYGGYGASASVYTDENGYYFDITYSLTYYTTVSEEEKVDSAVNKLLSNLNLSGKSDYEKIKAVYDYICANVTYDYEHLNDTSYLHQFTAYAALIDGTAVCQGYAVLLYRLALELDVDCRFIGGVGGGGPHGWNIIEMENLYYNADSTWDAGQTNYSYFLKSPSNFPDHSRDPEFNTSIFNKAYPMGTTDYAPPAHTHSYTAEVTAPNCTEQGYTTYTCACGDTYIGDYVDPTGHSWDEGTITKEPTEEEAGIRTFECENCDATKTEEIDKLDHVHKYTEDVTDPTCTEQGYTTLTCACGYSKQTEFVDPLGHDYAEDVTPPTCTEGGYSTFTCRRCEDSYVGAETEATGHHYEEVVTAPGCTEGGYTTYTCVCGDTYTGDETDPTGHDYATKVVAPTCTEEGYTTYICLNCNDTYTADYKDPTGHKYSQKIVKPTCTEGGYTSFTCTCGDTYITDEVEATGHTEVTDARVEATCIATGLTEGSHCSVCDLVFVAQEVIPLADHTPGEPIRQNAIPSTCSTKGSYEEVISCTVCEAEISRTTYEVEKTEHTYEDGFCTACNQADPDYDISAGNEMLAEGTCGDDLTWTFYNNNCLVISGTGDMTNYGISTADFPVPWADYKQEIFKVIIEEGVTSVGDFAFYNANYLTTVSLPSTVTRIGNNAFDMCAIEVISLPENLTTLGIEVFAASNLTSIVIPKGVTQIPNRAFESCSYLTKAVLHDDITVIGLNAFFKCVELSEIALPAKLTHIGDYAFQQCFKLTDVTFPESFTTLGNSGFNWSGLETMTFQCSAPLIGDSAFADVTATAYYPAADTSWTEAVRQNYGGNLTWVGNCYAGHVWDEGTITKEPTIEEPGVMTYTCTICKETREEEIAKLSAVQRIAGADRIETALAVAKELKAVLGVEKFDSIILAAGGSGSDQTKFADALSGSYLASAKKAPILLYTKGNLSSKNIAFIEENLSDNGTIYLLGGNVSIPAEVEDALIEAGYATKRLGGADRYQTNLIILDEAGIDSADEILVAGGQAFADSLSASATGLPIMLVNGTKTALTTAQIEFLQSLSGKKVTILGGTAAVSSDLETAIEEAIGYEADRIYGDTREHTSAMIAEKYFADADMALIAYSRMYPDGLAGGVLANALHAPLLLTKAKSESIANDYITEAGIEAGYVLGGTAVMTDDTARAVFGLDEDAAIDQR